MRARLFVFCFATLLVAQGRAQTGGTDTPRPTPSARPAATRPGAKGPLPDPVLLDGSNQPAEKKPDYGMLGDFEIPGDENSKSGKVGGQQDPNQKGGGGGQQQAQNQSQQGGGGQQGGMPQGGGSAGGQPPQGAQTAQQGGGGAAGGQPPPNQNGQPAGGGAAGGDPNAKAEGIQVAGLEGEPSAAGGAGGAGDNVPKPQQVAIGDKAMQINPAPNAPGVVGQATVSNSTQQMESKIGKGSGAGPSGGNGGGKGVEKGRTMPSGL